MSNVDNNGSKNSVGSDCKSRMYVFVQLLYPGLADRSWLCYTLFQHEGCDLDNDQQGGLPSKVEWEGMPSK